MGDILKREMAPSWLPRYSIYIYIYTFYNFAQVADTASHRPRNISGSKYATNKLIFMENEP